MKLIQIISLITLFSILVPYFSLVQAQVAPPETFNPPNIPTRLFTCDPNAGLRRCILGILSDVLKVILVIALAFAAVMIAWAGIEYILKGGAKAEERDKMKNRIIFAALGLVVAFLAWVIVAVLSNILTQQQGPNI